MCRKWRKQTLNVLKYIAIYYMSCSTEALLYDSWFFFLHITTMAITMITIRAVNEHDIIMVLFFWFCLASSLFDSSVDMDDSKVVDDGEGVNDEDFEVIAVWYGVADDGWGVIADGSGVVSVGFGGTTVGSGVGMTTKLHLSSVLMIVLIPQNSSISLITQTNSTGLLEKTELLKLFSPK